MRRSESACRRPFGAATLWLFAALVALPAESAGLTLRKLRIESEPPGAEVLLIGGKAGHTPLTIGERALYPNDYPDDQAHLYGTVTLRRAGCETVVHRVTLDDIARGLKLTLDCAPVAAARGTPAPQAPSAETTVPQAARTLPAVPGEALSQRRLRQLQVLQELLDEGLISAPDEQRIRRRLLETPF